MHRGLLGGEAPVAHELLDEAVVVGEPAQLPVAQQIGTRVADMTEEQRAAERERALR